MEHPSRLSTECWISGEADWIALMFFEMNGIYTVGVVRTTVNSAGSYSSRILEHPSEVSFEFHEYPLP